MHSVKIARCLILIIPAFIALLAPISGQAQINDLQDNLPSASSVMQERGERGFQLVISQPGYYSLRRDIRVQNGDGIVISASNVTLDLSGHTVTTQSPGTGRGIFVSGASNVAIKNGKLTGFQTNVMVLNSANVTAEHLQISGLGLAPAGGPSEIGIQLLNTRSARINDNTIHSVNLGIFVRGGQSTGNRIFKNIVVGGAVAGNNLLGICYNPAPGGAADDPGPSGDNIYNNHIARFGFAVSISAGSLANIFNENTFASFNGPYRDPQAFTQGGGTNLADGNLSTIIQ